MKRIHIATIICMMAMWVFMPMMSTNVEAKTYTIKFATVHPPVIPSGIELVQLEKVIPERTNGQVKFRPFLGGSLYDDYTAVPQVQAGALEMSFGGYNLSAVSTGWNIISGLPYLIDDYDHYLRFCETDVFKSMTQDLESKGIKHLAQAGHPGFANAFNRIKPIEKLEDFKGLKMRVPPIPAMLEMCKAFSIQNVTVTQAEVPTALETGLADGTFTPVMKLKGYGLIRNTPYATVCNTTFIPQTFVVSTKWWNSLPPDLKQILQSIFLEYGQKMNQGFRVMEGKLWEAFEAAPKTVVVKLTAEEKARWVSAARPVWEQEKAKSEEARMVIEAIESVR